MAICDDMPNFLGSFNNLIAKWPNKPEALSVDFFQDGDSLIEAHTANPYDLIILDVLMPLLNGIETAAQIRRNDKAVSIIFLTSSPEFAIDSYSVKANNYLLKPVNENRLYDCLDECCAELLAHAKSILVKNANAIRRVSLSNIEYVEARGKQVLFALSDGTSVNATEPFYVYENQLLFDDGFYKCHRSYIVNIQKINTYTLKELTMQSGLRIPIARSCQKDFGSAYFEFMFGKAGDH